MGLPMAQNLSKAGYGVVAWNRTAAKAQTLTKDGIEVCQTAAAAAHNRKVIMVMASDAAACDEVLFGKNGAASNAADGATVIVCSSLAPQESRLQAKRCAEEFGLRYADAPVSGGERGAKDGTLAIMVGASAEVFADISPMLSAFGKPVYIGAVGCGQLAKLANQMIVGTTIAAVAEALLLAECGGANPKAVREAMLGGFANSEILRQHGARMLAGDVKPGGAAKYQLRDLHNALAVAKESGLQMPCAQSAAELFGGMINAGMGEQDHSALHSFMANNKPARRC